jgi:hypothetical protein
MPSKFKFGKVKEKQSKGFTQKTVDIIRDKDTKLTLADAKEIEESFKNNSGDNSKFVIRGRINMVLQQFVDSMVDGTMKTMIITMREVMRKQTLNNFIEFKLFT